MNSSPQTSPPPLVAAAAPGLWEAFDFLRIAIAGLLLAAAARFVLIEVPSTQPGESDRVPLEQWFKAGRLRDGRRWYMETPTAVEIEDGRVTSVRRWSRLRLLPAAPLPAEEDATPLGDAGGLSN